MEPLTCTPAASESRPASFLWPLCSSLPLGSSQVASPPPKPLVHASVRECFLHVHISGLSPTLTVASAKPLQHPTANRTCKCFPRKLLLICSSIPQPCLWPLALSTSGNFPCTLISTAATLPADTGVPPRDARGLLLPLLSVSDPFCTEWSYVVLPRDFLHATAFLKTL